MPAKQPVVVPFAASGQAALSPTAPLAVKFMFLRVMLLELMNSAPRCPEFWIVPPVPAVVLGPFTVNEPVALGAGMPLGAPLAFFAWEGEAPVAGLTGTALPGGEGPAFKVELGAPRRAMGD